MNDAVVRVALARLTPNALAQTEVTPTLRAVLTLGGLLTVVFLTPILHKIDQIKSCSA